MSLKVVYPNRFTRQANRLARKRSSLVVELRVLHERLSKGEKPGARLVGAAAEVYKIRLANPSGQRGKSGGFRVAYHVGRDQVTLLAICLKPKCDEVKPPEIRRILRRLDLI